LFYGGLSSDLLASVMSVPSNTPNPWTPDTISTVVYHVVMIIVSIAFIWRKYRQPVRSPDGKYRVSNPTAGYQDQPLQ
jgi:hypothetical protein